MGNQHITKAWKRGFDLPVAMILASDVSSWLAGQNNLKPNSYNEISRQFKNIFELALNDRVISGSPYAGITNRHKRVTKDRIPFRARSNLKELWRPSATSDLRITRRKAQIWQLS